MAEITGPNVTPGAGRQLPAGQTDSTSGRKSQKSQAAGAPPAAAVSQAEAIRKVLAEVGARAETIQRSALAAQRAIETLGEIEDAIVFALDAAKEATAARGLPEGALGALQGQVDLAITSVDRLAAGAACGGARLFDGKFAVEAEGERIALPQLSSQFLGGATKAEITHSGDGVEYSQSIASAASGGPNSLLFWADGAAQALSTGLATVRELKASVESFYNQRILPSAGNLAVTLANTLAAAPHGENVDEVMKALTGVRRELQRGGAAPGGAGAARSVLRLLE
jgi:hypothetical protein